MAPVVDPETNPRGVKKWYYKITRDTIIFVTGLGGIINEAFIFDGSPREALLLLFGAMVGLPAFLRVDEQRDGNDKPQ